MTYIWIDLGNKRVGIAKSEQNIAFPVAIVPRVEIISYLKKFFQEYPITHIIVWLPYDLYGKDTKQLEKTREFIKKLEITFQDKKIIGHDERFSSFIVDRERKDHRDDFAAQYILQSYIDIP